MKNYLSIRKQITNLMLIALFALIITVIYLNPALQANIAAYELSRTPLSEESLMRWAKAVSKQELTTLDDIAVESDLDAITFLQSYSDNYEDYNRNHIVDLFTVKLIEKKISDVEVDFQLDTQVDENFPEDKEYLLSEGAKGLKQQADIKLFAFGKDLSVEDYFVQHIVPPQDRITVSGKRTQDSVVHELSGKSTNLFEYIKKNDEEAFSEVVADGGEDEEFDKIQKIKNLGIITKDITFEELVLNPQEGDFDKYVEVGNITVNNLRCNKSSELKIVYNKITKLYLFKDVLFTLTDLCDTDGYIQPLSVEILTCTDCTYAPVDKEHALPSKYIPKVIDTGLSGGGKLTADTVASLANMFTDAKKSGFNLTVVSAYRSYNDQVETFDYWMQREIAAGATRAVAEQRANVYSARPGQSEHQLGTTVDLGDANCSTFNEPCNKPVYQYIEENAHRFGFIISYPKGTQSLTGYKYEAWHIRYIGVDLALEMYKTGYLNGSGDYLAKFLLEKKLY